MDRSPLNLAWRMAKGPILKSFWQPRMLDASPWHFRHN